MRYSDCNAYNKDEGKQTFLHLLKGWLDYVRKLNKYKKHRLYGEVSYECDERYCFVIGCDGCCRGG